MCGIAGFYSNNFSKSSGADILKRMTDRIIHRGPDSDGHWISEGGQAFIGHRRLAIIDLSSEGAQPMVSQCQRYVLAFNGEIYNYVALRDEVLKSNAGIKFRGASDTEVLLNAISLWGIDNALKKINGMFAISLYDREENSIYLIRDRLGEKPLYWGISSGTLFYGSEIGSCLEIPEFKPTIDRNSLALLLKHNYIPAPYTIFSGLSKLRPGHYVRFCQGEVNEVCYWDLKSLYSSLQKKSDRSHFGDVCDQIEAQLRKTVAREMHADVPLGAFLSGGVDSSLIVALMQQQSARPIKTFTIGFEEDSYNEAPFAAAVAKHLGTDHTEVYLSAAETLNVIPKLASIYDEPFSDSSQIPTYLVSRIAREKVTVSLSGDGGDELFGGYQRYLSVNSTWNKVEKIPLPLRRALSGAITSIPADLLNQFGDRFGDKLHKKASVLSLGEVRGVYDRLVRHWDNNGVVLGASNNLGWSASEGFEFLGEDSVLDQMMLSDLMGYLPNDILTKVDRAAMSVSLETRVPFLDHEVVELAMGVPADQKIRNGKGKLHLREILYKYVPKDLVERPKMGFGVPLDRWLRGPLKEWASDLLSEDVLRRDGFFNPEPVLKKWSEHLSGQKNWQYELWDILMFQEWLRSFK